MLVRAGEPVIGSLSSANRDGGSSPTLTGSTWPARPTRHLGFGHGVHHCLGAQLARMELQVALAALLTGCPGLRLAVPEAGAEVEERPAGAWPA